MNSPQVFDFLSAEVNSPLFFVLKSYLYPSPIFGGGLFPDHPTDRYRVG
jgi:hypothetical protein